jgi:hypothetical protein
VAACDEVNDEGGLDMSAAVDGVVEADTSGSGSQLSSKDCNLSQPMMAGVSHMDFEAGVACGSL